MSEEVIKTQLSAAHQAFNEGKFREAEQILHKLPQDSLKVQHNLVAVQYLLGELEAEKAIAQLEVGLIDPKAREEGASYNNNKVPVTLKYVGHETALYNLATVCARAGHPHKALAVLRGLLELEGKLDLEILGKCVCLFHTLTASGSLGKRQISESDAALEDNAMKVIVSDTVESNKEVKAKALRLFSYVSESNTLVDAMKTITNPVEKSMCLNNLGAFSLKERKPYVATLCFSKAREVMSAQPNHFMLQPIRYNAGLCALLREEHEQAIEHFLSVQEAMKTSPVYWVRVGEAALGVLHKQKRASLQEEYARRQATYSHLLHEGHMYENFEFLMLPNAVLTSGPSQESATTTAGASEMELLAATALQNALFLLVPPGKTYAAARAAAPHNEILLSYALLYWACLELHRHNYTAVEVIGHSLLDLYDRHPPPANLHVTLLSYLVEALVHLNQPEKAMKILRKCQPISFITGSSGTDQTDVAQRSRVEVLLIQVAITQILSGAWSHANNTMEFLIAKIFDSAPAGATEFQPEADAFFAYQMLAIFLELAQGKQSEAAALLGKVHWSI